jgi:hypothetical protein
MIITEESLEMVCKKIIKGIKIRRKSELPLMVFGV